MTWMRVVGRSRTWTAMLVVVSMMAMGGLLAVSTPAASGAPAAATTTSAYTPAAFGELDCNHFSPAQQSVKTTLSCTDVRGFAGVNNANTWGARFYDNGHYIGHDEPDMTFLSNAPGTGNDVTWTETVGADPPGKPTIDDPGSDVADWFELSPAPWYSMALCDPNSYPQLPCTPESDSNAPTCTSITCAPGTYPGGGSTFMEMQLYPPGFAPFSDSISCDNTHWCAALTIDSLECTSQYAQCNNNCIEPVNFAFIQTNGVPTGPPSPQLTDLATFTPNSDTLLMDQGDKIAVHMSDAPVPGGGGKAFKVVINDMTTHQSGSMQASAANGFQNTSITDCAGTPFNFQPEYNTAAQGNIIPWAADQTDISTEYETGHWEPCNSLSDPGTLDIFGITDTYYNECHGTYENTAPGGDGGGAPELSDAECYMKGDTHGVQDSAPDTLTGCIDELFQNGDLDFDGSPYWTEWPTGPTANALYPSSFVEALPTSRGNGYSKYFIQTDIALSEYTCKGNTLGAYPGTIKGCTVPPKGPGGFYPYWSRVVTNGACTLEFGNVSSGPGVNDLGQDAQYGTLQLAALGYPQFEGPVMNNSKCG